jgi:ABC-2 type transport system permease protein
MLAIIKKELKTYFTSYLGYIVLAIFLFALGVAFHMVVISQGVFSLGTLYYMAVQYGLPIMCALLTMGVFSKEKKLGTDQILFTAPISTKKIVLAKILAQVAFIGITLLLSLIYYMILCYFGTPSLSTALVQLLGILLISVAMISVGTFFSSLTENQVLSALFTLVYFVATMFLYNKGIGGIFNVLCLPAYFLDFYVGAISTSTILGLVVYTLVFYIFTVLVLNKRKLNK